MRWILGVIAVGLVLRLFYVTYPLGDLHSWRQADTAAVARNLKAYGTELWLPLCKEEMKHIGVQGQECRVPLLNPQIDSFVTIDGKATWMDGLAHTNDTRNHFAEFPIYQAIVAQAAIIIDAVPGIIDFLRGVEHAIEWAVITVDPPANVERMKEIEYQKNLTYGMGIDNVIVAGRLVSIGFSLWGILLLSLIVRKYFDESVAIVSAAIIGWLPYAVFWSRTVLPDTMMVTMCLAGLWALHNFMDAKNAKNKYFWAILVVIFWSIALLMKVFVLFLLVPVFWLLYVRYGLEFLRSWHFWVMLGLGILPFLLWRWWIHLDVLRLPGIPASGWLFNGSGVRLKPAWWYWLFQTRLDHYMFNFIGLGFVMIAVLLWQEVVKVLQRQKETFQKASYFWLFVLLACFGYLVVFATGNLQHEYYQLPLVPFIAVLSAMGIVYIWNLDKTWHRLWKRAVVVGLLGLMWMFGMHKVIDWYGPRMPTYIYAGMRVAEVLPAEAIVVADFGGDTTMLYYTNRPGWSIVEFSFEELIKKGATHYVSAFRSDGVNALAKQYVVVEETSEYVILDLRDKVTE